MAEKQKKYPPWNPSGTLTASTPPRVQWLIHPCCIHTNSPSPEPPVTPPPAPVRILWFATITLTGLLMTVTTGPARAVTTQALATLVGRVGKTPYDQYRTSDRLGRDITYYLARQPQPVNPAASEQPASQPATINTPDTVPSSHTTAAVPLVVFIQGSGSGSHFIRVDDKIGTTTGFPHIHDALKGRGRVLVVEKPGVDPFSQPAHPGSAEDASETFRSEHTLDRWAEAVEASIRSALTLPGIDPSRLMVIGHSEGGLVAARVAADEPRVTHVACLAGGGPTQLYDFFAMARRGGMFDRVSDDPDQRVAWLRDQWAGVMSDPMSTDKLWLGHPHRRWSTFCSSSPVEQLARSHAKVYIAQGTADTSVSPDTADILAAELIARGRDVTLNIIQGGDHGFFTTPPRDGTGMQGVFLDAVRWFLDD